MDKKAEQLIDKIAEEWNRRANRIAILAKQGQRDIRACIDEIERLRADLKNGSGEQRYFVQHLYGSPDEVMTTVETENDVKRTIQLKYPEVNASNAMAKLINEGRLDLSDLLITK